MNTCYVLNAGDGPTARVVATLLNSTWMRALATMRAPSQRAASGDSMRGSSRSLPFRLGALEDPALMRAATARAIRGFGGRGR